ncbi:sugar phosphate isomerase/epimerase family protein [Haladaptatus sp. NG-SE-30]
MGVGYTTIMYDAESLETGVSDIAACQYDGIEIGLEKVRYVGEDRLATWLDEYNLDLYLVMSEWLETEDAIERVAADAQMVANLGAEYLGMLPPQRGRQDDETVEEWFTTIADASADAGVTPLIHHHGATHVEQPNEIETWLDRTPENVQLVWDTAHHYPYGEYYPDGDVTDGVERFADDIAYVHLKDVAPPTAFTEHREALSSGTFHLDDVINYFRSFTDLGRGILDFEGVYDALEAIGYDGHYTIEIENRTEKPLVHAKENIDFWRDVTGKA